MRVKLEKLLFRQTAMSQTTAIRSLVHRALAEMETWRRGPGLSQEGDVMAYTESWQAHMAAVAGINESLLAFSRGVAAAAASFHMSAAAASVYLTPITSGEALLVANADGGAAADAAAAAAAAPRAPGSAGASAGSSHALTTHASFFGGSSSAAGGSGTAPAASATADGAAADGSTAHSVGVPGAAARHALTLSVLTSAIAEVLSQAGEQCAAFAATASADVAGDPNGPLGRKHDGKHLSAAALAEKDKAFRSAIEVGALPPKTLLALCGWYAAAAEDIRAHGQGLVAALQEAFSLAVDAYTAFETAANGLMAGQSRPFKGKDLWLLELRYRRCCRVALAVRLRFMSGMATLFERYRIVEAARTELIAAALERLAAATARCFDRVSTRSVGDALRPLNTHADFFRIVGEDTKARIAALHEAKAAAERASAASHAAHHHVQAAGKGAAGVTVSGGAGSAAASPASTAGGSGSGAAAAVPTVSVSPRDAVANAWLYGNSIGPRRASASNAGDAGAAPSDSADAAAAAPTTGSRSRRASGAAAPAAVAATAAAGAAEDAGSSGSGASGGGTSVASRRRSNPLVSAFHFELEPLPLVMTPLSSPLVVRVGRLMRQVGMMKTWRPFVGVLTRDGFLYLLQIDSDAGAGTSGSGSGSSSSSSSSAAAGDDLATHPDVLHAVLKWSAERLSVSTHGVPVAQLSPASASAAASTAFASGSASASSTAAAGGAASASGGTGAFAVSGPAAAAAVADVDSGIAGAPPLPAPALPPQLMAMAAAYAGNVSDLLLAEEGEEEAEADGRRRANARGGSSGSASGSGSGSTRSAAVSSALLDRARKADRAPGTNFPITASVKLAFAPAVHADAFEISDRSGFLGMTHKLLLRATTPDDAVDWVVALNKAQELVALGTGAAATGGEP